MREKLLNFLAKEGLSVDALQRFESFYDKELQGETSLEIMKQLKAKQKAEADNKIDVASLAEQARIR